MKTGPSGAIAQSASASSMLPPHTPAMRDDGEQPAPQTTSPTAKAMRSMEPV